MKKGIGDDMVFLVEQAIAAINQKILSRDEVEHEKRYHRGSDVIGSRESFQRNR
jgi:hypothetical protein